MNCQKCGLPQDTGAMGSVLPQCICHWKHTPYNTIAVKELNDSGEPVKNATYWKWQYNLMATQNDNLKSGLYHANEQIKYLETHPVKELTDEEIRELGRMSRKWQDPYVWLAKRINRPLKDLTNKEIQEVITEHEWYGWTLEQFARAILRKAQEK